MKNLAMTPKLTLVFILFGSILLLGLGAPAYALGREALRNAIFSELLSTSLEKESSLADWVQQQETAVAGIADHPHLREIVAAYLAAPADSPAAVSAQEEIRKDLLAWVGDGAHYYRLELLDASTGRVLIASDPDEEGKFRETQPYFLQGLQSANVQNPTYNITHNGAVMLAGAPIRSPAGATIAVLGGMLNTAAMNEIIERRSGLRQTDDAFLVNRSNLLVTQPHLLTDPGVLRKGVHSEAVNRCLAHNSGAMDTLDYRGTPATIVYRWLPERQLCLITKIDQREAYAPVDAFAGALAACTVAVLLIGVVLAFGFARSITEPIKQMATAARRFGSGQLDSRAPAMGNDEIGLLAQEFNKMAATLAAETTLLRRQREQIFRLSVDLITIASFDGYLLVVNPSWSELLGYSDEELKARPFLDFVHPDDRQATIDITASLDQGDKVVGFQNRYRRQDGAYRWLQWSASSVPEERLIYAIAHDVTDRRQADELLRASENQYRALAETSPDMIFVIDAADSVRYVNTVVARQFGKTPDEIIGLARAAVFPAAVASELSASLAEVFATGRTVVKISEIALAGRTFWLDTRLAPMHDETGAVASVMGITRDITALKQHEAELRALNTRFELALRSAALGIWDWDLEHQVLLWDKRVFELFGVADPHGQNAQQVWLQGVAAEDRARVDAEVALAIRGEQQFDSEFRALWPDGSVKYIKSYAVVVRNADGAPVRVIGTNLDITARKEAELTLAQRSQDLARSNAELERFAYVASHDLQEPLRMISSYLQLLERRYKGRLDTDADEFIAFAVDGANRMKALINDLLAFSRIGSRTKPFAPTNFEDVLARVCANLAVAIQETGATITHEPLPTTLADENQMLQLLQNLVANAIKFRNSAAPAIHLAAARTGEMWTFQVRDNGIGIAAEYFERIFVVFQRLHPTTEYPGTGIGLSICKKIVERHGGHIWVESTPGAGSTFYFTLPAIDA